ncbi:MAG: hypothetical protein U1E35_01815 [Rhodospirillales bacterium]
MLDLGGIEVAAGAPATCARGDTLRLAGGGDEAVVVLPPGIRIEEGVRLAREHAEWIRARLAARPPHASCRRRGAAGGRTDPDRPA